jgi:hypothetical protein
MIAYFRKPKYRWWGREMERIGPKIWISSHKSPAVMESSAKKWIYLFSFIQIWKIQCIIKLKFRVHLSFPRKRRKSEFHPSSSSWTSFTIKFMFNDTISTKPRTKKKKKTLNLKIEEEHDSSVIKAEKHVNKSIWNRHVPNNMWTSF